MAKEYQEKRTNFADRLKSSPVPVPMQEVNPVSTPAPKAVEEEQIQINVWIPKSLMKRLKSKALYADKNLKTCVQEALESYLSENTED